MSQLHQSPKKPLPDVNVCRAGKFGDFMAFAECLTERSRECIYHLDAGEKVLCFHPACAEIVVRTHGMAAPAGAASGGNEILPRHR